MWESVQAGDCSGLGPVERRNSMAKAMPSAARLTQNVFDDENNNGSDESTETSLSGLSKMTKLIYSKLDSFSDTTSENGGGNHGSDSGAISDGSNSIARPDAYPPD